MAVNCHGFCWDVCIHCMGFLKAGHIDMCHQNSFDSKAKAKWYVFPECGMLFLSGAE